MHHGGVRQTGTTGKTITLTTGDPEILVSLGSDDPGIFAENLNSEFYQLYSSLRNLGINDTTALQHVSTINENGKRYRFHSRFLG